MLSIQSASLSEILLVVKSYYKALNLLCFRYIKLVRKHGLEISQPGLEPNKGLTWQMTMRRGDGEVHK